MHWFEITCWLVASVVAAHCAAEILLGVSLCG